MKHIITITIDGKDTDENDINNAGLIREHIANAVKGFDELERPTMNVSAGIIEAIETERHDALIELARERYAYGSSDDIEVDGNARLSDAQDEGCWVQGWLWLSGDLLREQGLLPAEGEGKDEDAVESEGGSL